MSQAADVSSAVASAVSTSSVPIEVYVGNPRPRAMPGIEAFVYGRLLGPVESVTAAQLWVNDELVDKTGGFLRTNIVLFRWTPSKLGTNDLVVKILQRDRLVASGQLLFDVMNLQRPQLEWIEKPAAQLFSTNELSFAMKGTDADGKVAAIRVSSEGIFQSFFTNGSQIFVRQRPNLPGTYIYSAEAIDDDGLGSEYVKFTVTVEAIERLDLETPKGLAIKYADRFLGRPNPDTLKVRWDPPSNTNSIFGTMVERKDPETGVWKVVAYVDREYSEWREIELKSKTFYAFRVAFVSHDRLSRSPFSAEAGEMTPGY